MPSKFIHIETLHNPHSYGEGEIELMCQAWAMLGTKHKLMVFAKPLNGCDGCQHCRHQERLRDA